MSALILRVIFDLLLRDNLSLDLLYQINQHVFLIVNNKIMNAYSISRRGLIYYLAQVMRRKYRVTEFEICFSEKIQINVIQRLTNLLFSSCILIMKCSLRRSVLEMIRSETSLFASAA